LQGVMQLILEPDVSNRLAVVPCRSIVGSELERRSGAAGSVWVASECRTRADQKAVARQVEKGFGPLGDELDLFIIADIVDDTGILACAWTRDAGGLEVYCVGADK